ncbi:MAG: hypothetical protein H7Z16_11390 [Pyrinomonadaceae bacterium]|nr:hypothetical protein [Pyrinomonadaceae bacterium]
MNQYEVNRMAQRLIKSQEKFVASVHQIHEVVEGLIHHMAEQRHFLGTFQELFRSWSDLMQAREEMSEAFLKQLESIEKVYAASCVATNENSERMDKLLSKVEGYFGTGGLDFDN